MASCQGQNVAFKGKRLNRDSERAEATQKGCDCTFGDSPSAFINDQCVAHLKPPERGDMHLVRSRMRERFFGDRIMLIAQCPGDDGRGIDHKRHQYLCPSWIDCRISCNEIFLVCLRMALMLSIAASI